MRVKTFEINFAPGLRERDERVLNTFLAGVDVLHIKSCVVRKRDVWCVSVLYDEPADGAQVPDVDEITADPELSPSQRARYQALRAWRDTQAERQGCRPFSIASNRDLSNLARSTISRPEELLQIHGFGPGKTERYGEQILALLASVGD